MALEINIPSTKWGFALPNAYVRLDPRRVRVDDMDVFVEVYASKEARSAGGKPLPGIALTPDGSKAIVLELRAGEADIRAQAYARLKEKALRQFAGAKDV